MGVPILVESGDVNYDGEWDLGNPFTISTLHLMIVMGLLDMLGGGPALLVFLGTTICFVFIRRHENDLLY